MSDTQKPGEWLINPESGIAFDAAAIRKFEGIHVVEYSALTQAEARIKELEAQIEQQKLEIMPIVEKWRVACEQNAILVEALEQIISRDERLACLSDKVETVIASEALEKVKELK